MGLSPLAQQAADRISGKRNRGGQGRRDGVEDVERGPVGQHDEIHHKLLARPGYELRSDADLPGSFQIRLADGGNKLSGLLKKGSSRYPAPGRQGSRPKAGVGTEEDSLAEQNDARLPIPSAPPLILLAPPGGKRGRSDIDLPFHASGQVDPQERGPEVRNRVDVPANKVRPVADQPLIGPSKRKDGVVEPQAEPVGDPIRMRSGRIDELFEP